MIENIGLIPSHYRILSFQHNFASYLNDDCNQYNFESFLKKLHIFKIN